MNQHLEIDLSHVGLMSNFYSLRVQANREIYPQCFFCGGGEILPKSACPVKFFAEDSAADLSAGFVADLTGVTPSDGIEA